MKIRTGFVSNSSSSSFVAFLPEEDFKTIQDSLSILDAAVVSSVGINRQKFLDKECISFGYTSGNYSTLEYIDDDVILEHAAKIAEERGESLPEDFTEEISEGKWDSLYTCRDKINSLPKGKVFTHSEDF